MHRPLTGLVAAVVAGELFPVWAQYPRTGEGTGAEVIVAGSMRFSRTGGTVASVPTLSTYALVALVVGVMLAGVPVLRRSQARR